MADALDIRTQGPFYKLIDLDGLTIGDIFVMCVLAEKAVEVTTIIKYSEVISTPAVAKPCSTAVCGERIVIGMG
jgi:hypothetical protein